MNRQKEIYEAVVERGYKEAWTDEQFLARQAVKLGEELGELINELPFEVPNRALMNVLVAGQSCQWEFDYGIWPETEIQEHRLRRILKEAADMQVVLCCLAEAAAVILGEEVDLMDVAFGKARGDVVRGVRKEKTTDDTDYHGFLSGKNDE